MNAETDLLSALLSVLSVHLVFLGIIALFFIVSVPEALLIPLQEFLWGLRCLLCPNKPKQ